MSHEQTAHRSPYLSHLPLGLRVLAVILVLCGAGAFFTRQYSASAVLALNLQAVQNTNGAENSPVEIAWSVLSDQQITDIINQFRLNGGMTSLRAQGRDFTYVRSNISFTAMQPPGSSSGQVAVSYTGESPSQAIGVANAIAMDVSEARAPARQASQPDNAPQPSLAPIAASNDALEKSRERLQQLSQAQGQDTSALQAQLKQRWKKDAALQAQRRDAAGRLAALEQQSYELSQADARAQRRAAALAPKPNPARTALELQIVEAQNRLTALRQRYTELYPDVQETESTLAALQARLSRMPPDNPPAAPKPPSHAAELSALVAQEDPLRLTVSELDDEIRSNQDAAQALRKQITGAQGAAQAYAAEQQRYNTLLQVQEALDAGASAGAANASPPGAPQIPLFMIVESASFALPVGVFFRPAFWILTGVFALLAAAFSIYMAEQFAPAVHEKEPFRSFYPS